MNKDLCAIAWARCGALLMLLAVTFLLSACSSADDRFSTIETDEGTYVVDQRTGKSFRYPPEKPVDP